MRDGITNAVIHSVSLRMERGFLLDCYLHLDYGGLHQGFGGWALYLSKTATHHEVKSVAGHHIWRCMEIAGVESWDRMAGRTLRAKVKDGVVVAIGHIVKDDWYCPREDFDAAEGASK